MEKRSTIFLIFCGKSIQKSHRELLHPITENKKQARRHKFPSSSQAVNDLYFTKPKGLRYKMLSIDHGR